MAATMIELWRVLQKQSTVRYQLQLQSYTRIQIQGYNLLVASLVPELLSLWLPGIDLDHVC